MTENFENSKLLLKECVTLTYPNPSNPLALSCDASDTHIGGVLEELQEGAWRPIGFWSKNLSPQRRAWSIFRRELLSIQQGIRHFLPDIVGRELTVFTDHRSILGAMTAPSLQVNDPIASRQLLEIAQYTYDIRYKPGKTNLTADQMSRPFGVPMGDAYCPSINVESISSLKPSMPDITPLKILEHQSKSEDINRILQGKHSPRVQTVKKES